jgi:hypothetical protein
MLAGRDPASVGMAVLADDDADNDFSRPCHDGEPSAIDS